MSSKKLIKLISNDINANFDNQFRNEILIKKNSEVALHSLSMTREEQKITIGPHNDLISFDIGRGVKQLRLKHGRYTVHQLPNLIDDLNKKLNNKIEIDLDKGFIGTGFEYGSYFESFITNNPATMEIQFKIRLCRPPFQGLNVDSSGVLHDMAGADVSILSDDFFKATDSPNPSLTSSFLRYSSPFIRGCGSFRVRIGLLADNINPADSNGFIFGLTSSPDKFIDGSFSRNDINFGIEILSTTSNYNKIVNGTTTDAGTPPKRFDGTHAINTHDYLDISQNAGRLVGRVYQINNTVDIFDEPNLYTVESFENMTEPNDESLYGFVIFFSGNSRVVLGGMRYHGAEEENTISFQIEEDATPVDVVATVEIPRVTHFSKSPFNFTFNFEEQEIATFFGFRSNFNISEIGDGGFQLGEETFIASQNPFLVLDVSDIYMIELLNIPLDSYEGFTEQRKNVLAVIPVNENNVNMSLGTLQYESTNLNYISINNEYDFSLRNIKARIVNSRFEPIVTNGTTHITIFTREMKE